MIKKLAVTAIMSKAQAAAKLLPKGQKTLERFFGTGTAPGSGKKLPAEGKSDSVKRKRSPSSKKTVTLTEDAMKHSIVVIEDSPPAKKLQTAISARRSKTEVSDLQRKTEGLAGKQKSPSRKRKEQSGAAITESDAKGECALRRSPRKKNENKTLAMKESKLSSNGKVSTEAPSKEAKLPLAEKIANGMPESTKRDEEPAGSRTPERLISDDEDDLFDIATPEKKTRIRLPDVSARPAAFKVVRLKVKDFERSYSEGVNLVVGDDVESDSSRIFVLLSGSWLMTNPALDTEIFVFGMFQENLGKVDSQCGFVVLYPQHLLSITTITAGLYCKRKSLLNQKFKRIEPSNSHLIVGTVAHEVFQRAVSEKLQRAEIVAVLDEILARSEIVHDLYLLNSGHYEIKAAVLQMIPHILSFMRDHLSPSRAAFQIDEIIDIEDNLLCPRLGVRGKVDLTVRLKTPDGRVMPQVPLELKTGKPTFGNDHMAQVFFYTAMLNEKSGKALSDPDSCDTGILTYISRSNDSRLVKPNRFALQSLMQQRNELATSWEKIQTPRKGPEGIEIDAGSLGEFKEDERGCSQCSCRAVCSLYAKMTNDLPAGTVRAKVAEESLGDLSKEQIDYVWHWLRLLDKECSKASKKTPSAFWMIPLDERVASGNCIKDLQIDLKPKNGTTSSMGGSYLRLRGPIDLESTSLAPNSYIAVSEQGNKTRVANRTGFVHEIGQDFITLSLINDVGAGTPLNPNKVYCVDKMNSSSSSNTTYTNLVRILQPQYVHLRELVIDRRAPTYERDYPRKNVELCQEIFNDLNDTQVRAIIKTLMSNDYLLLKGMPGTGKTSVIVATVRALVKLNQRVLVTSYTHNALDNILERLDKFGVDFVRIGNTSNKVIRAKSTAVELAGVNNVNQVKKFYSEKMVFGATCLGTNNVVFEKEKFDYCIVDEASQVLQPTCLGPIMCAKKFLLVGDPDQLSPVILSRSAKRFGMDECLFKRLQAADSSNLIALNYQYRMNSEIMALSNGLVYENKLVCGNDQVANRTLKLDATKDSKLEDWQRKCVSGNLRDAVVFLDLKKNSESTNGRDNLEEANLIRNIINLLIERGLSKADIGVISSYTDQVTCLKGILPEGVESSTIDRYQGKEKEVMIMSCVRTGTDATFENEIMNDLKRINVAISRARSKLILVGCKRSIGEFSSWEKLFAIMRDDQFVEVETLL
ncbi:DNA replication ATP-dependent helicase/nuclease DNA2 [Galendromus occidentalis]|uniref:DNA replication ATP-dependent helicase/nuclease n=1 Tax=Galendromus occidentalis TaxID=34638 RepID=A0AAJ7SHN7_9ACAR|nr:DNA replication ATP-dependent helicase/nuclease DNA2 [Galendromus occidentalis]